MVNFRYHVVTLIAVFLALALGVVLGAGPLQKAIDRSGDQQASIQQLQTQLEATTAAKDQSDQFIWDVAGEVLPGTMKDKRVAVVLLPGSTADQQGPVDRVLEIAQPKSITHVPLSEKWNSADQATYRQTLATAVSAHLKTRPAESSPEATLAQGLMEVLTSDDPATDLVKSMLTDQENAMVVETDLPKEPIDMVILVGPAPYQKSESGDAQMSGNTGVNAANYDNALWKGLAGAASLVPSSAAVGSAASPNDFIAVVRAAGVRINTIDQGGTPMSALNTVLATLNTEIGAYGQQTGATRAVAPLPAAQ